MDVTSSQNRILLILFVFLASLYMITTPGYFTTSMGSSIYVTAKSLVEEGNFALDKPTLETGIGTDGKYYVYQGLAFILIAAAFFSIIKFIAPHGFLLITNQILTAAACLVIYLIGRELKYSKKTSILLSLIYGVATMAWVHSRYLMPEPLTTLVYLTSFLFLLKYKNRKETRWLFLCGCFTGLALIVRRSDSCFPIGELAPHQEVEEEGAADQARDDTDGKLAGHGLPRDDVAAAEKGPADHGSDRHEDAVPRPGDRADGVRHDEAHETNGADDGNDDGGHQRADQESDKLEQLDVDAAAGSDLDAEPELVELGALGQ